MLKIIITFCEVEKIARVETYQGIAIGSNRETTPDEVFLKFCKVDDRAECVVRDALAVTSGENAETLWLSEAMLRMLVVRDLNAERIQVVQSILPCQKTISTMEVVFRRELSSQGDLLR